MLCIVDRQKERKNKFISVWKVFSCVCYWIWWFGFLNIDFEWMCNLYICIAWVHVWIYQCYRPNFKHSFTSSTNLIIIQKKTPRGNFFSLYKRAFALNSDTIRKVEHVTKWYIINGNIKRERETQKKITNSIRNTLESFVHKTWIESIKIHF